jgi:hypothetical protein
VLLDAALKGAVRCLVGAAIGVILPIPAAFSPVKEKDLGPKKRNVVSGGTGGLVSMVTGSLKTTEDAIPSVGSFQSSA